MLSAPLEVVIFGPDKVSGLFRIGIKPRRAMDKGEVVRLSTGPYSFDLPMDNKPVDETCWVIACSHLLPNGENIIEVKLDGGQAPWSTQETICVVNHSDLAVKVAESLKRSQTPVFVGDSIGTEYFDFDDPEVVPWFDREDAEDRVAELRVRNEIDENTKRKLLDFLRKGYVVLESALEDDLIAQINDELDQVINNGYQGYKYGESQRLHDLHAHYPGVNRLWKHPEVMNFLKLIFSSDPRPCQTLTYIFGSQQGAHQDTVHLTPFPAGYMCGVWAALEDVRDGSGELVVYEGSHRLPRVYLQSVGCAKVVGDEREFVEKVVSRWNDLLSQGDFEEVVYRPKAGDVLIWHENLMHAGSKRESPELSRRSIVSHVFADGCIAFYDSSGNVGNMEPL